MTHCAHCGQDYEGLYFCPTERIFVKSIEEYKSSTFNSWFAPIAVYIEERVLDAPRRNSESKQ